MDAFGFTQEHQICLSLWEPWLSCYDLSQAISRERLGMLCFHVSGGFELEGGDADSETLRLAASPGRRSGRFSPWQFTAWLTLSNTCFPPHAGVKAPAQSAIRSLD